MTFYTTGYATGNYWWAPPPPPPPPVEIVFEHAGRRRRVLVLPAVLQEMLRLSAIYEAELARQRPQQLTPQDAEVQLIALSREPSGTPLKTMVRRAKRLHHPDMGGDPEEFRAVIEAEQVLKQAGLL